MAYHKEYLYNNDFIFYSDSNKPKTLSHPTENYNKKVLTIYQ